MNKKLKIIIGALALVVIIVLTFFFWRNWQQKQEEKLGYVQFDSFVKQETNGQIWYENKDAGIKFMVPAGWNINPSQLASVALTSSDFQPFSDKPSAASIPSTGCWIGVSVKKEIANTPYDILYTSTKKDIDGNYLVNTETDKYKKFTIGNYKALLISHISNSNLDNTGKTLVVNVAEKNSIYSINTNLFGKDQERCSQSFNDFLATVLIQ